MKQSLNDVQYLLDVCVLVSFVTGGRLPIDLEVTEVYHAHHQKSCRECGGVLPPEAGREGCRPHAGGGWEAGEWSVELLLEDLGDKGARELKETRKPLSSGVHIEVVSSADPDREAKWPAHQVRVVRKGHALANGLYEGPARVSCFVGLGVAVAVREGQRLSPVSLDQEEERSEGVHGARGSLKA